MDTSSQIAGTVQSIEAGRLNDTGMNIVANKKGKWIMIDGKLVKPEGNVEVNMPIENGNMSLERMKRQIVKRAILIKANRDIANQEAEEEMEQQGQAANKQEKEQMEVAEQRQRQELQERDKKQTQSYSITNQEKKGMSSALKYSLIGGSIVGASVVLPSAFVLLA